MLRYVASEYLSDGSTEKPLSQSSSSSERNCSNVLRGDGGGSFLAYRGDISTVRNLPLASRLTHAARLEMTLSPPDSLSCRTRTLSVSASMVMLPIRGGALGWVCDTSRNPPSDRFL